MVTAAVILLTDIQESVSSIPYPNNGFGVLLSYAFAEVPTVIVWKDNTTSTFDESSGSFFTVDHFDANLAKENLYEKGTFTYTGTCSG